MPNRIIEDALAHHRAGRLSEATAIYRGILEANPYDIESLHLLGVILAQSGQPLEGAKLIQRAIDQRPGVAVFHANMGYALRMMGRADIAVTAYQRAVKIDPNDGKVWLDLAQTLVLADNGAAAVNAFRRAIALQPNSARAHNDLGSIFLKSYLFDDALACFQRAGEADPQFAEGYHNLAMAMKDCGRVEEALEIQKRCLALAPEEGAPASALIYLLQFHPGYDRAGIHREMQKYNERFGLPQAGFIQPHGNNRDPNRRLRVGYVSPDFYLHAECYFVLPLLQCHNHEQFEIHCYSSVQKPDGITELFKACADVWHDVSAESHESLAERIRADQIDILVDLTMHMRNFRLPVFARKPAPVQVTWLAYPGGTGLTAIDYRLTDAHIDPPDCDQYYSEKSVRLPGCWCCFDPLAKVEDEAMPPNGFVRFGSLNNPNKLNDTTLRLWRRVLQAVPDSRLMLLVISEDHRNRARRLFSEVGVDESRLEFTGRVSRMDYFKLYNKIDVCLDPLPYNGITTTLDALWMGTPVVTLVGQTAPARAGLSILSTVGLPELIAHTPDRFVEIAASRRMPAREEIRKKFRESPLMDASQFARNVEHAYREMWQRFIG